MLYPFKHASFDVWNTLITANPAYAAARTKWIADNFNISLEQAKFVFTHVKKYADGISELNGTQVPTDDLYELLVRHIDGYCSTIFALNMRDDFEKLFIANLPTVDPLLVTALKQLVADGVTISIGSNTNFMAGKIMKKYVLDPLDIPFSFMLFSDEEWHAKPHPNFFGVMYNKVEDLHTNITKSQVIHIGDSERADVLGAQEANMHGILVANPAGTLQLLNELKAKHA